MTQDLVNLEEGYATEATGEAIENKYLDLLVLPAEGHNEKWGIYCIALDNPTYLQVMFNYKAIRMYCTYIYIHQDSRGQEEAGCTRQMSNFHSGATCKQLKLFTCSTAVKFANALNT